MTERLADIGARLSTHRQLGTVVNALRGIAANRATQAKARLAGVNAYATVAARGIAWAAAHAPETATPEKSGGHGLVLFCSEFGLAGALSERMLKAHEADCRTASVFLVGTRGVFLAEQMGLPIAWSTTMAFDVEGLTKVADRISDAIFERVGDARLTTVDIAVPVLSPGHGVTSERRALLPLDRAPIGTVGDALPPLVNLPLPLLLERLTEEYVFAQLCAAVIHSFATECEARIEAMSAAHSNIDRAVANLENAERRVRQDEVTAEIIELAAGAAAVELQS